MENEEVNDPQGLLKAYRQAQADLVALREEHKSLQERLESVNEDKYKPQALNAEIRLALQSQGIKNADRVLKYLGTDGIDFNEEGQLDGLQDRLETLKTDLPELFDIKRQVGGKADIGKNTPVERELTASERQAAILLGNM